MIRDVFEDVIAAAMFTEASGISMIVRTCDDAPLVCDHAHLEEVLHNLITNAADAMPEGGEIALSYRCQPARGKAVISVADHGHGIAPEQLQLLFEPYFTTKKGHLNMGLGLYYCWNVMAAHNGSIRVESKPGCGSTFSLCFPVRRKHRRNEETT